MKKKVFLKIVALVVLNVFVMSFGLTTFGATPEIVSPRWTTLATCSNLFEIDASYDDYDVLVCGGDTTVGVNVYAYVKVELQYLRSGSWRSVDAWKDEGHMIALVEEYIDVQPGYTYRLLLTHKALDADGNVLETYETEAESYITTLPRN